MLHLVVWVCMIHKSDEEDVRWHKSSWSYRMHRMTILWIRFLTFWLSYSDPNWWITLQSTLPLRRIPNEKIHNCKEYHLHVQLYLLKTEKDPNKNRFNMWAKTSFHDFIIKITLIFSICHNKEVALLWLNNAVLDIEKAMKRLWSNFFTDHRGIIFSWLFKGNFIQLAACLSCLVRSKNRD